MATEPVGPSLVTGGILLLLIAIVMIIAGVVLSSGGDSRTEWAVVGFIGPVPIGVGTDKRIVLVALVTGLIVYVAFLLLAGRWAS